MIGKPLSGTLMNFVWSSLSPRPGCQAIKSRWLSPFASIGLIASRDAADTYEKRSEQNQISDCELQYQSQHAFASLSPSSYIHGQLPSQSGSWRLSLRTKLSDSILSLGMLGGVTPKSKVAVS